MSESDTSRRGISYAFLFLGLLLLAFGIFEISGAQRIVTRDLTSFSGAYSQSIYGMREWAMIIRGILFSLFGIGLSLISVWGIISARSS